MFSDDIVAMVVKALYLTDIIFGWPPWSADPDVSPASAPPSILGGKRNRIPEAAPPHETFKPLPPVDHSPAQGKCIFQLDW